MAIYYRSPVVNGPTISLGSKTVGVVQSQTTNVLIYARQKLYTNVMNERSRRSVSLREITEKERPLTFVHNKRVQLVAVHRSERWLCVWPHNGLGTKTNYKHKFPWSAIQTCNPTWSRTMYLGQSVYIRLWSYEDIVTRKNNIKIHNAHISTPRDAPGA